MAKYNWCPHPNGGEHYGVKEGRAFGFYDASVGADAFGVALKHGTKASVECAVAEAERLFKPAALEIALPAGWVAHTPYLAERTADRAVVVMDQHGEAAPYFSRSTMPGAGRFSRSTMPGAGRFGAFYHLRAAVEFYDKQWPARPAGWTWQAADEDHGSHWRRDADGYRVTETLDQWRGVTPDGYMTTGYYKTAEAVMAFAEQTRPVK